MKCIAYVSRVPISERSIRMPTGLLDIVRISREHNPKLQITGIISYRQGQYLQVLEGPKSEVDNLMKKITQDPRQEDLWVFLDMPIFERSFPNWGVNVFDFVDQGTAFNTFIEKNSAVLNNFDVNQKNRIQSFITTKERNTASDAHYDGKSLRLMAWPDLNEESQPQMIMNLCIKLTKKPYPFDALISSGEFGTHDQLTQTLRRYEHLGLLSVTEPNPSDEPTVNNKKKPGKFFGAIKKFLGMR